jgi:cyclic beta-1,2-glucan synthetase
VRDYLPWMLLEFSEFSEKREHAHGDQRRDVSIKDTLAYAESIEARLVSTWKSSGSGNAQHTSAEDFRSAVSEAVRNLRALIGRLETIAVDAERFGDETEFGFLADPNRQILSIGYEMSKQKIHEACYDMLASEARIATFLAVARGDLRQQSWFKLARDFAQAFGHFLLLSWTGTMFEYLMPALWMRSFPNTLVSRTQAACVNVQQDFAHALGIPWGISESGCARKDDAGHYHYHAYGVPQIALWFEADAGPVIAPYATFLALTVDCREAIHNLRRMESLGWVGVYGFYESADYTSSLRKPMLTREWMAHHQGMSLLSVVNLLCENVVQRWFHANPIVQSAELLLHELPTSEGVMKARLQEFAPVTKGQAA